MGRPAAAGLARALCGPALTAAVAGESSENTTKRNETNPQRFLGLDSAPRATSAGTGAAGVVTIPGLLGGEGGSGWLSGLRGPGTQAPASSVSPTPPPPGGFLRKDARHRGTCSGLAWGTMPRALHSRGTGQRVLTPPWLAREGVVCAGAVRGPQAPRLRGPAGPHPCCLSWSTEGHRVFSRRSCAAALGSVTCESFPGRDPLGLRAAPTPLGSSRRVLLRRPLFFRCWLLSL
ncbi:uncharacterized protein LOC120244586 isoform X1 [Hyaena hyaena]|uniref:uncharacterized protein LOC120244586 isoform X1 n=1 Tax=Hyaena hyaena TaxID=95912 RepID=UPI00192301EB|nr:uncharacterized protein LOC120244586 isoform X1 [Hyaena hyaena]